jgi:ferredoxin
MVQEQDLFYAAAGKPTVDMNKYNLEWNQIVSEWTALITPKTTMQAEGIYLGAKNEKEYFVDTLRFTLKREGGLGLILSELAGGREDGVGITIVEDIVQGGNSAGVGILPGDSIVALAVNQPGQVRQSNNGGMMESTDERFAVDSECRGYDATVDAITSLPAPCSAEEEVEVTVKRIRRKPKVNVKLQFPPSQNEPDVTIELFSGENLRRAMLTRGVNLNDALSKRFDSGGTGSCGAEGTCATCLVSITKGDNLMSPAKIQEEQILADKPRWRMACKAVVGYGMTEGDMTIQVNPKRWN